MSNLNFRYASSWVLNMETNHDLARLMQYSNLRMRAGHLSHAVISVSRFPYSSTDDILTITAKEWKLHREQAPIHTLFSKQVSKTIFYNKDVQNIA